MAFVVPICFAICPLPSAPDGPAGRYPRLSVLGGSQQRRQFDGVPLDDVRDVGGDPTGPCQQIVGVAHDDLGDRLHLERRQAACGGSGSGSTASPSITFDA